MAKRGIMILELRARKSTIKGKHFGDSLGSSTRLELYDPRSHDNQASEA